MLPGKVPPGLLARLLSILPIGEDVLIGPGEGLDFAALMADGRIIVASTDPITGAEKRIGFYAVHVNANDVAVSGARPRWFLTTILLPEDADEGLAERIVAEIAENAEKIGVSVVGGHTEVTPGLNRPIVVGTMIGVAGERLVRPDGAMPGDAIVLTKWAGLEGTAIIAEERWEELVGLFGEEFLGRATGFLEMISVLPEAMVAGDFARAIHDPTEGGIANGLHEMANSAGLGFRVYAERIPIREETEKICGFYSLNPLALISSGALLIAVPPGDSGKLVARLREKGIPATVIGEFLEDSDRRVIVENGWERPLERPASDELWKVVGG
ncbi:AIR synthase family protein [Thermococcus sp.]|uniref:AIR synthase family protein n=1 Tax=Thermococcus sp. TaxID=35749 RepID=UPI00261F5D00|nr:AIR synthase family protein [Thermococcus sp.]